MQYEEEIAKEAKERQLAAQNNDRGRAVSSNLNEQVNAEPIRTAAEAAKMVGRPLINALSEFRRSGQQPPEAVTNFVGTTFSAHTDEVFPKRKNLGRTENVHLTDGQLRT